MSDSTLNVDNGSSPTSNSGSDSGSTLSVQTSSAPAPQVSTSENAATTTAKPSASVPESRDAKKARLVDIVTKSIKGDASAPSTEVKQQEGKTPLETNPDGTKKDGVDEVKKKEEDARLDKHPRFQEITKSNRELKAALEAAKPDLEDYRSMKQFMGSSNLQNEEVRKGFEIMAAMKNDPVKALQLLAPYIQSLQQFAGNILPADLQNQVDQGLLTPEHAALIVRNQNQNALLLSQSQQRQKLEQQSIQQRQQQEAAQRRSAEITQAVGGWEERIRKTDPDFAVKEKFLLPAIEAEILKQPPRTPQEAVDLADRIYKGVSINLREVLPRRQSISPIPSNTASSHGQAEPRTALEAVTRGIRMTHAPA